MAVIEFLKLAFPAQRRYSETRCPAYGFWSSVLHIRRVNFCTESLIFIPHKIYVLPKVVRAKLPGPWEGGGCGGKKHPPNYIIWCFFFFFFFLFLGFVSWAKLPWLSLTCGWAAACQRQWGLLTFFVFSYHFIVHRQEQHRGRDRAPLRLRGQVMFGSRVWSVKSYSCFRSEESLKNHPWLAL